MTIEQYLLAYSGFSAEPGVCHLVVSRDAPGGPVALVGELDDNPGTSTTNAMERVASAIAAAPQTPGAEFGLYQYDPQGLPDLKPSFYAVVFRGASFFSMPTWESVDPTSDEFLAEATDLVRAEDYSSRALHGIPVIDATERALVVSQLGPPASVPA